jgi:hypothetical protein
MINISRSILAVFIVMASQNLSASPGDIQVQKEPRFIQIQKVEKRRFIEIQFDIFKYGTIEIIPSEKIVLNGGMKIASKYKMRLIKKIDHGSYIEYIIIGHDENGNTIKLSKNDLRVFGVTRDKKYKIINFDDQSRKIVYEIILDKSGSMSGEPIQKLKEVVEFFLKSRGDKKYLCRVRWFDHMYYEPTLEYESCSNVDGGYKNMQASGTTKISETLKESYESLHKLDSKIYGKGVIIVSDGQDQSSESELQDAIKRKNGSQTFVYIIADGSYKHKLEEAGDFFVYNDNEFEKVLKKYLESISDLYGKYISIQVGK